AAAGGQTAAAGGQTATAGGQTAAAGGQTAAAGGQTAAAGGQTAAAGGRGARAGSRFQTLNVQSAANDAAALDVAQTPDSEDVTKLLPPGFSLQSAQADAIAING